MSLSGPSWGTVHQNRPITADQLAMALAMATGSAPAPGASSSSAPSSSSTTASSLAGRQQPPQQPPTSLFSQPPVMPSPPPPVFSGMTGAPASSSGQSRLISPTFFQQAIQAALEATDSSDSNSSNNAAGRLITLETKSED